MNGRKPNKAEKAWINSIMEYGCVVCRQNGIHSPSELHHINGGSNHLESLPICYPHHNSRYNGLDYVSRHPWKAEWEKRYGKETDLLAELREKLEY